MVKNAVWLALVELTDTLRTENEDALIGFAVLSVCDTINVFPTEAVLPVPLSMVTAPPLTIVNEPFELPDHVHVLKLSAELSVTELLPTPTVTESFTPGSDPDDQLAVPDEMPPVHVTVA